MAEEVKTITVATTPPVGIENLKKAVKLVIDLGQQINSSLADGYQWTDLLQFVDELSQVPGIIKNGSQIVGELKDLSDDESAELKKYVQDNFDIPNDEVEEKIERSFAVVFSLVALIESFSTK